MKVVVTGSSGMIGTALCERLLSSGNEVVPVDRERNRWNTEVDSQTRLIDLLTLPHSYDLSHSGVDSVVHCAANARVHQSVLNPGLAIENMQTCAHALEFARQVGAHFIFASSREVYGNQELGKYRENDTTLDRVESPYAASKLAGEALVQAYGRVYGLPTTIVRLSNVYGRYDLSERFIPTCVRAALSGSTLTIFGEAKRLDFTYLDDVIDGLVAITGRGSRGLTEVFNLATGNATPLSNVAVMIGQLFDCEMRIVFEPSRPGEVISYEADISKAIEQLGYKPKHTLHSAFPLVGEWYRQQYRSDTESVR